MVQETQQYLSLNDILEALMNACFTRAHDPYITIDQDRHWAPHIELLLRWVRVPCLDAPSLSTHSRARRGLPQGIAVKHATNPSLLKLVEFHL